MHILAIETTGKYGTAAVIDESGACFSASSSEEMNHLKDIITISDEAVRKAGISKKDLTHVAASIGPGSFTGIRIGVTTARTIGQMLDIPCIAVGSLVAMAYRVIPLAMQSGSKYIISMINARRHQVYAGVFQPYSAAAAHSTISAGIMDTALADPAHTILIPALKDRQYMIEELLGKIQAKAAEGAEEVSFLFTGDGIDAYEDIIRDTLNGDDTGTDAVKFTFADENLRYQHAETVARIALNKVFSDDITDYDRLLPDYKRLAEAEQRLKAGTLSDKIKQAGGHMTDR